MGWYDDENEDWLPEWAVQPMMWLGCLMAAVIPAGIAMQVISYAWAKPPTPLSMGVYAVSLGLMIAVVKPWTVR